MRKIFLLLHLIFVGAIAVFLCTVVADVFLGGGCSRSANLSYEPIILSHLWEWASYIYTWAPEDSILRSLLHVVAIAITFALPVVLAWYMLSQLKDVLKKYREA
jgi:hypothetical protein